MLSARALRSAAVTFTIQMRATSANAMPALTRQNMALDRFVLPGHGEIVKRTDAFEIPVFSYAEGSERKSVEPLSVLRAVFQAPLRRDVMHRAVVLHLASLRQGTAKSKTRAEVSGGGKKPWKQKGTGRARHGSIRSPIWVGGGRAFPKIPRSFEIDMPKQLAKLALRSALSAKFAANQLEVWHALDVGTHRTAAMTAILRQSNWSSVLFVDVTLDDAEPTLTFTRVIANLPNAHIAAVSDLNVYDILKRDNIVLSRRAAERLNVTLAPRFALPPPQQQAKQQS